MSQHVWELDGQRFDGDVAEKRFLFEGFDQASDVDARIKAFGTADPASGETEVPYFFSGLTIQPNYDVREIGTDKWYVTARYGRLHPESVSPGGAPADTLTRPEHGDQAPDMNTELLPEYEYSTSGGTLPITQSLKTWQSVKRGGGAAANYRGAIGYNPITREVKGTEKHVFTSNWTISVSIPKAAVTAAYLNTIESLYGKVNDTKFFGYQRGRVLFMGVSPMRFTFTSGGLWRATFHFGTQRHRGEVKVVDDPTYGLTLNNVHGWSHVWVTYSQEVIGGLPYMIPDQAYEEQIYEYADLNAMNLHKYRKKS
jgi:hypothetical protein